MSRLRVLIIFFILMVGQLFGQITITLDNEDDDFFTYGDWIKNENNNYYDNTAWFKMLGEGNATAGWKRNLHHPGTYKIEIFNIDYQFASNAQWKIKTASGDSLVFCNMYKNPGWLELGEFSLEDSIVISLSDYADSDSGDYVYIDAALLTAKMPLYSLETSVNLTGMNTNCDALIYLYYQDEESPIDSVISNYRNRNVGFTNLPDGNYRVKLLAPGYEGLVRNIDIDGTNQTIELVPEEKTEGLYTVSGSVFLQNEPLNSLSKIHLYSTTGHLVALDSVIHNENFELVGIPEGVYQLKFSADGYAEESKEINVIDENIDIGSIYCYAQFKFAWITDSHYGIHFTDPYLKSVINDINNCPEQLDFIIHTGDLTEHGYNSELNGAKIQLEKSEIPYYVSIGNHDTKWSESGLTRYQDLFGDLFYSFDHKGFHFICLNNAITLRGAGGYFNPVQYEWLKQDLAAMPDSNTPVIVMYHIPSSPDAVPNHWRITNILKDYRVAMILTGHGHNNRVYDFDGLPGVMGMDTYSTDRPSGYNVVSLSEKEISFTPYLNDEGVSDVWYETACPDSAGAMLDFSNIEMGESISEPQELHINLSKPATLGNYIIQPESETGALQGSGKNWQLTLDPATLENGYHTVKVTLMIKNGGTINKTFAFYTENGDYPKAVWRFNAADEILSKPAYNGDKLFFGTGQGKFYALNSNTGDIAWKLTCDGAIYSSPAVSGEKVYVGTNSGSLYAVNCADGSIEWQYQQNKSMQSGIFVKDSLIYLGAGNELLAINKKKGELSWSFSTGGMIESRPAIAGDKIVCTAWDTKVYCINRLTGEENWNWGYQSSMYYAPGAGWPVIMNDLVFVVDPSKQMSCLSLSNGHEQWTSKETLVWDSIGKNEKNSQVYVRSLDGNLYAFEPTAERNVLWKAPAEFGFDAKPSMPFGKLGAVFAGGSSGNVVSVSQATGNVKWIYHTANTLVNSVTPKDGVSAYMTCLDGTVAYITGDPALDMDAQLDPGYRNLLLPNYPNPFNNKTTIQYTLKQPQRVSIAVYDILGKEIMKTRKQHERAGYYSFTWNAFNKNQEELASGLYIVRLKGEAFTDQKKVLFLK